MRLRDLRTIIEQNLGALSITVNPYPQDQSLRILTNYAGAISAIESLKRYGLFQSLANELASVPEIYDNTLNKVTVDMSILGKFTMSLEKLKASCVSLLEVLDTAVPKQDANALSIKLPDFVNLSDLKEFFEKFDLVLNQSLVNKYVNGEIRLLSFDNGSYWVEILIVSQFALTFFTSLVWAAAVIRKKIVEVEILEQQVTSLKIKNESLNDIKESAKKHLDLLVDAEAANLVNQLSLEKPDPEYTKRLKHSIKLMGELIAQGTEVHPALMAPEEVKNLLPNFKALDSIQSKIKQIAS